MLQVLGSIIVFPAVIGLLTVVLLAAEARLRPQRKIKITINGDEAGAIETDAGGTLLNTLSSNGVMLAVRVRRRRHLRRMPLPGNGRRRRHPADRAAAHQLPRRQGETGG